MYNLLSLVSGLYRLACGWFGIGMILFHPKMCNARSVVSFGAKLIRCWWWYLCVYWTIVSETYFIILIQRSQEMLQSEQRWVGLFNFSWIRRYLKTVCPHLRAAKINNSSCPFSYLLVCISDSSVPLCCTLRLPCNRDRLHPLNNPKLN